MTGALRGMHTGLGGAEGHRQTLPLQPETQREGSRERDGRSGCRWHRPGWALRGVPRGRGAHSVGLCDRQRPMGSTGVEPGEAGP